MRSFFNCTKATQHVDPASHTQTQAVPKPLTRVQVENMLKEYVRDGSPAENRMEAKTRMLACFDELHPSASARGLAANRQTLRMEQHALVRLNLKDLQLKMLPENLGFLKGVGFADFSENKLETLPGSIGDLSSLMMLELSVNQLQSLPDSIGKLAKLSMLCASENQLECLPESIGKLSDLGLLDLDVNKIQTLPESIGDLANLSTLGIRNNSLRNLPESIARFASLTKLDLRNINYDNQRAYARSGQTISLEAYCEQHTNRLETLPESIGNLQTLDELSLNGNPLRELPQSLVCLPTSCRVNLIETDLPQTVREQLQNAIEVHNANNPEQGPRIEFDMSQHNQLIQVKPLHEEIASWRQQASNHSAVETANPNAEHPQAFQAALGELSDVESSALAAQLARMRVTAHYKAAPQDLIRRVNQFLNYVEQATDVLKTCAAIAAEGTETCDDRIALAFIELEEAIVHHQSLSEPNMAKLLETASGLHKSQLLKDIAQKKVSTLVGFVDPTEIILKYIVNLSKEFKLPSQLNDMIFHNCALQVSSIDIEQARQQIQAQSSDADLNTYLASWQPWKQALQTQYPEQYTNLQNKVSEWQASLYEQMEGLSEQLGDAKTTHGERSDQYLTLLTQSNGLHTDYRNIETNLLVRLTEQARQHLGQKD